MLELLLVVELITGSLTVFWLFFPKPKLETVDRNLNARKMGRPRITLGRSSEVYRYCSQKRRSVDALENESERSIFCFRLK